MKTFDSKIYDDWSRYIWDNKISFCPHEEDYKASAIVLNNFNLIAINGDNNECNILLNNQDLFSINMYENGGSSFDTCYSLLLELESILIQEGEDFGVSIAVYYEKDDD